ncbi:hypothetical protein [Halioxenophilus sp. WMMB6]|uniref:hypothetical protein n=1 Tax=Halioxenophilus sp. WMMB6 TaxID=3073815 RepID=UPI00295F3414|nr:hypothetical protein [Halioxenophilus sp. WMMB6]
MAKRRNTPRNLHACHPIMGKGGVHEKSKGAKRQAVKHETRRKSSEWLGRSHFYWSIYCRQRLQACRHSLLVCIGPLA